MAMGTLPINEWQWEHTLTTSGRGEGKNRWEEVRQIVEYANSTKPNVGLFLAFMRQILIVYFILIYKLT